MSTVATTGLQALQATVILSLIAAAVWPVAFTGAVLAAASPRKES